jgi:hypothetical protein
MTGARLGRALLTAGQLMPGAFAGFETEKEKRDRMLKERMTGAQISNIEADNLRQKSATDLANSARVESTKLSPVIAEGLANYQGAQSTFAGRPDSSQFVGPGATEDPLAYIENSAIAPVGAAMMKNEDLGRMSPLAALSNQPWNASDLKSAEEGRQLYGGLQKADEDAAKAEEAKYQKEQDRLNRRDIAALSAGNRKNKNAIFDDTPEGEQDLNDYVDRVASGDASPDMKDLASRGAVGASARLKAQALFKKKYPELNLQQEVSAYAYWNNPKNQNQRQVMDVVSEQLPNLVEAANELKATGIPYLDRKTLEARRAAGDVAAAKYLAAFTVTVEDVAKGVAGGNALTDDQLKLANQIIYKGGTPEQIEVLAKEIQAGVDSRKMTMYKRGGIQARKYAEEDPWLSEDIKKRILSGDFKEAKGGSAGPAAATPGEKDYGSKYGF